VVAKLHPAYLRSRRQLHSPPIRAGSTSYVIDLVSWSWLLLLYARYQAALSCRWRVLYYFHRIMMINQQPRTDIMLHRHAARVGLFHSDLIPSPIINWSIRRRGRCLAVVYGIRRQRRVHLLGIIGSFARTDARYIYLWSINDPSKS
jgi:hypothetical protein